MSDDVREEPGRVLSIQSHTVSGYVGNRCSIFTLQLLNMEADAINSVQFSNHGGYPTVKGQRLDGPQLTELVDGLEANGLLCYDFLLTGYIGTASMLEAIADLVMRMRQLNPELHYVCDPVMGDNGKLFLPDELVPLYQRSIVPLAATVTPNAFEAEKLTGLPVTTEEEAVAACQALHNMGPSTVIITSMPAPEAEQLLLFASTRLPQREGSPPRFKLTIRRLDVPDFAGPGDLMTALLLGWSARLPGRLREAVLHAVAALQGVLAATADAAGPAARSAERSAEVNVAIKNCRQRELKLVHSQHHILQPQLDAFDIMVVPLA